MAIKTIPSREIEKFTRNIFEVPIVVAKRTRQIIADRFAQKKIDDDDDKLQGLLEEEIEIDENYVEPENAISMALREFLNGELEWRYSKDEEQNQGEESNLQ